MNEDHELIAGDGRLSVYKTGLTWRRARRVTVRDADGVRLARRDFPPEAGMIEIDGLPADRVCEVLIQHDQPLKRLFTRPTVLHTTPRRRRLKALVSGSGRCGTVSVSRYLDGLRFRDGRPCAARHETLWEHVLPRIIDGDADAVDGFLHGFVHDIESAPHFSLMPDRLDAEVIVHLIRDGRRVVQSGLNRGWYAKDTIWNAVKPDLPGDVFEKCCRFWDLTNRNVAAKADLTVRLEDLIQEPVKLARLVEAMGLEPTGRPFPVANAGKRVSTFDHWPERERATFETICGGTMDEYYRGWRAAW